MSRDPAPNASAEGGLEEELELHRAIMASLAEGVYAVDRDGRVSLVNAAAERLLGWTAAELRGRDAHETFHFRREDGSPLPKDECPLLRVVQTGEVVRSSDDAFTRRDGTTFPVSYVSSPVRREGRVVGAVVAFHDVSEARETERRLREAHAQAAFLARASVALDEHLELPSTLQALAALLVPEQADRCAVDLFVASRLARVVSRSADGAPVPERDAAVEQVARTAWPALGEREAIVPLALRGRVLGTLSLAREAPRRFTRADHELVVEVARRAAVALDNARLYEERSYIARTLQASLLPRRLPDVEGLELAATYRAAGAGFDVGGDFYDVFEVGGRWALVIGDVCGKGPEAAALTALVRHTARIATAQNASPPDALALLDEVIRAERADDRFCTAVYAVLEVAGDGVHVRLASGGHPPPVVVRAAGEAAAVGCAGSLLGVLSEPVFEEASVDLGAGDSLVLYTDGLTDAGAPSRLWDTDGVVAAAAACAGRPAARLAEALEAEALRRAAGEPRDDIAVLVARAAG